MGSNDDEGDGGDEEAWASDNAQNGPTAFFNDSMDLMMRHRRPHSIYGMSSSCHDGVGPLPSAGDCEGI